MNQLQEEVPDDPKSDWKALSIIVLGVRVLVRLRKKSEKNRLLMDIALVPVCSCEWMKGDFTTRRSLYLVLGSSLAADRKTRMCFKKDS
jgi:hypothetical protein